MTAATERSPARHILLLVEDNPGDARLVEEAFKRISDAVSSHTVSTGEQALDFVNQRGEHADAPRPDIILLDWNLPRTSGEEVLAELCSDPKHATIPVIVLTGSQSGRDVCNAYEQHANACLTKPVGPDDFEATIRAFAEFWLSIARLPPAPEE